jgi:CRP-like cAMP-binding protein
MSELAHYIQYFFGVEADEAAKIQAFFRPVELKKGDYFLEIGKRSDKLAFVQCGILREFLDMNDKEVTKWISTQGYFVVDLDSFVFHRPSRWNIQALTDCELYVLSLADYEKLGAQIPRWNELEKLFITKCFTMLEDRVLQHLSMSAEERYQQLFHFNKELFNLVPLNFIASMLGMTPETLSRLRRKRISSIS